MIAIEPFRKNHMDLWANFRQKLWPEHSLEDMTIDVQHIFEGKKLVGDEKTYEGFHLLKDDEPIGFIEVSLRDSIDWYDASPIAYIEGWFVEQSERKKSFGAKLVKHAEEWAQEQGCDYLASDLEKDNRISLLAHQRLGFTIVDENVKEYLLIKEIE
ncbi:hypothetical protein CEY16_10000 [Halalkalibacillus sediminis]|uniref:N-acetyltransferase domain-containing protein n=1 Tax=Halalkalibacillus sediminis TaxID=2018042 RepID=A0A2I0QSI7_9BACI|nr:GNAT family N-acetyltransferase [Halalkalibacillus sediminis]PKR77070.1 hypothetical protein CEY16_10000 [Halalkalibacillus sediminis]